MGIGYGPVSPRTGTNPVEINDKQTRTVKICSEKDMNGILFRDSQASPFSSGARVISNFDQKIFFQLKRYSDRVLSPDSEYRPQSNPG